jgi:hypothetical protein
MSLVYMRSAVAVLHRDDLLGRRVVSNDAV